METGNPPLQSALLLDQVRERIRYLDYSLSTGSLYICRVRFFIWRLALTHLHGVTAAPLARWMKMYLLLIT